MGFENAGFVFGGEVGKFYFSDDAKNGTAQLHCYSSRKPKACRAAASRVQGISTHLLPLALAPQEVDVSHTRRHSPQRCYLSLGVQKSVDISIVLSVQCGKGFQATKYSKWISAYELEFN